MKHDTATRHVIAQELFLDAMKRHSKSSDAAIMKLASRSFEAADIFLFYANLRREMDEQVPVSEEKRARLVK